MIMTNDNDHDVNKDDADNDADVTNVDEISFKRNRIVKGKHGGGGSNGGSGSSSSGGSSSS